VFTVRIIRNAYTYNAIRKNDFLRVVTWYIQVPPNFRSIIILYKSENLVIACIATRCN
jgi:hypothetical protein